MSALKQKQYYKAEKIGGGDFGSISAVYDDDGNQYAQKDFLDNDDYDLGYELGVLREVSILMLLRKYSQPYIIRLEDVVYDSRLSMIMPRMTRDLLGAIESGSLSNPRKLYISHKLSLAVAYLHKNNIIHRDIKTENILLNADDDPFLADFSLAKVLNTFAHEKSHTPNVGTDTFRAPEIIERRGYSFPVDIWSLGVVFLELFDELLGEMKERVVMLKIRKKRDALGTKPLARLIKSMLMESPQERATYADLISADVYSRYPKEPILQDVAVNSMPPTEIKNREIKKICAGYGFKNPMTMYAADIYSKHSTNIRACVILASKMYEEELLYDDMIGNRITLAEYILEEQKIFAGMQYCLFV